MTHTERRQQWKARIEAYKASGLSAREFCRQHNITTRQLYYWLGKETLKEQTGNTVQWLPVSLSGKEDTALAVSIIPGKSSLTMAKIYLCLLSSVRGIYAYWGHC